MKVILLALFLTSVYGHQVNTNHVVLAKTLRLRSRIIGRIIGGSIATASQFPFSAAIRYTTQSGQYFCGGALISHLWVLTAARCVKGATLLRISLGSFLFDGEDNNRVDLTTSEYVAHPDFDSEIYLNDIGLIKFRIEISYTDSIKPVDYIGSPINKGVPVVSLGWGQTSDSDSSFASQLHWVYLMTLSNEECSIFFGPDVIHDTIVCVQGNYNEGTCHGDIGSPLITYINQINKGMTVHVGVSSFISGSGCESIDPSGYTRTYPYVGFISNITGIIIQEP